MRHTLGLTTDTTQVGVLSPSTPIGRLRLVPASTLAPRGGQACGPGALRRSRGHVVVTFAAAAPVTATPLEKRAFIPVIGETPQILTNGLQFLKERTEDCGPVFRSHFAASECVIVTDSKLINEVLAQEHKTVIFDLLPSMEKLTQSSLFGHTSRTKKSVKEAHKMDRRFLMEFFTPDAIATYYPYIQSSAETRLQSWCQQPKVGFVDEIKAFTFDVMNSQLAGIQFSDVQLKELDELWKDFNNGAVDLLGLDLPFTDYGKGRVAAERIVDIIAAALNESYGPDFEKRNYEQSNIATGFLSQKNADGSWRLTLRETAEICRGLLFAGHETTSNAIQVMLCFLQRHPQVMERLKEEQAELMEKHGPLLTPEILEGTYTEATAVEVMRLQNIDETTANAGFLFRRALVDMEVGGKLIPKGTKVLLASAYCIYTIEDFLPTAEQFQPERWLIPGKSAVATARAKGSMAFGGGPRVCAGEALAWAEMKVFLSVLVRNTESWKILNPDAEWRKSQGSITKSPVDGMEMQFVQKHV